MQDYQSGQMIPLDGKVLEEFKAAVFDLRRSQEAIERAVQKAKDDAQPDRSRQGPVFSIGEELEIKGGRFEVEDILETGLILKGLPKP